MRPIDQQFHLSHCITSFSTIVPCITTGTHVKIRRNRRFGGVRNCLNKFQADVVPFIVFFIGLLSDVRPKVDKHLLLRLGFTLYSSLCCSAVSLWT